MKTLRTIVGFMFSGLVTITLSVGVMLAGLLGIVPGVLWLIGDWLSGGEVSAWLDKPFEIFKGHIREAL